MEIVADAPKLLEVAFSDVIRNKTREGVASFIPPVHYTFRTVERGVGLWALCVPVSDGTSRVFLPSFSGSPLDRLPVALVHMFGNKFLDTDMWLQEAERAAGAGGKYKTVTSSDLGTTAWRKWWGRNIAEMAVFQSSNGKRALDVPPKAKEEYLSWYETHVRGCADCSGVLRRAEFAEKYAIVLAFAGVVASTRVSVRAAGLGAFLGTRWLAAKVVRSLGDSRRR